VFLRRSVAALNYPCTWRWIRASFKAFGEAKTKTKHIEEGFDFYSRRERGEGNEIIAKSSREEG
jgi:hypothetical protein